MELWRLAVAAVCILLTLFLIAACRSDLFPSLPGKVSIAVMAALSLFGALAALLAR